MDRADDVLPVAVVAHRLPGRADAAGDAGIRDDPAVPDRRDDLVLAHHPVAVAHEVDEKGKTCGSSRTGSPPRVSSKRSGSSLNAPKHQTMRPEYYRN